MKDRLFTVKMWWSRSYLCNK